MTDKQVLFLYRLNQARETLAEAERMLSEKFNPRSIINRAYYSVFYLLLALYLKAGINVKTSKHSGLIALFDAEFVRRGLFSKSSSKALHKLFSARQESDYREMVKHSADDASSAIRLAREVHVEAEKYLNNSELSD